MISAYYSCRKRVDAKAIHDSAAFKSFDDTLQIIVKQRLEIEATIRQQGELTRNHFDTSIARHTEADVAKEHHQRVLRSLFFDAMNHRLGTIQEAHQGTFAWIFEHDVGASEFRWDNFRAWLENKNSIYWIEGKAGSGKSTLMRYIYTHDETRTALDKWSGKQNYVMLGYFLFKSTTNPLQYSIVGLLRALLYQILVKVPDLTSEIVPEDGHFLEQWTEGDLRFRLKTAMRIISPTTLCCLFIDGLDELQGDLAFLTELINDLDGIPTMKICVSSRPYHTEIELALHHQRRLRMQDLTCKDIRKYIEDCLEDAVATKGHNALSLTGMELHRVGAHLVEKADGVFLWVRLAVNAVRLGILKGDSYDQVNERAKELPRELDDLYKHFLHSVDNVYKFEVARYLRIMLHNHWAMQQETWEWEKCEFGRTTILTLASVDVRNSRSDTIGVRELECNCKALTERINAQFAGLLEVQKKSQTWELPDEGFKEIQSACSLSTYDGDQSEVSIMHRTALDFLEINVDVLDTMDGGKSDNWSPLNALSRAHIRRIISLPWAAKLFEMGRLAECLNAVRYVRAAERMHKRAFNGTINALDKALSFLLRQQAPEADLRQYYDNFMKHPKWADLHRHAFFKTTPRIPETGNSWQLYKPTDTNGLCAAFALKYSTAKILSCAGVDPTYLLQSALDGLGFGIYPWQHLESYYDTISSIVEAGADPNAAFSTTLEYDRGNSSLKAIYPTMWRFFLSHLRHSNLMELYKALSAIHSFLVRNADPAAMTDGFSSCLGYILLATKQSFNKIMIYASMNVACWLRCHTADFSLWRDVYRKRGALGEPEAAAADLSDSQLLRRCCTLRRTLLKLCNKPVGKIKFVGALVQDYPPSPSEGDATTAWIDTDVPQFMEPLWKVLNIHKGTSFILNKEELARDPNMFDFVSSVVSRLTERNVSGHQDCVEGCDHDRMAERVRNMNFISGPELQVRKNHEPPETELHSSASEDSGSPRVSSEGSERSLSIQSLAVASRTATSSHTKQLQGS